MNKLGNFTCGAVLALTPLIASAADTLSEIYQLALTNDPALRAANAAFNAGKESIPLGRAGILPRISANAEFTDGDGDLSCPEL